MRYYSFLNFNYSVFDNVVIRTSATNFSHKHGKGNCVANHVITMVVMDVAAYFQIRIASIKSQLHLAPAEIKAIFKATNYKRFAKIRTVAKGSDL